MLYLAPDAAKPRRIQFGIAFWVTPRKAEEPQECERAPDDGAGNPDTGAAVSLGAIFIFPEGGGAFLDLRPPANVYWHYRFRAAAPGTTPSSWSAWFKAKPDEVLPEALRPNGGTSGRAFQKPLPTDPDTADTIPDGTGKRVVTLNEGTGAGRAFTGFNSVPRVVVDVEGDRQIISGDWWVDAAKRVKVGTIASPSSILRSIVIPAGMFNPVGSAFARTFASTYEYLQPDTTATDRFYVAPLILPIGCTLKELHARFYRQTSSDVASVELRYVEGGLGGTTLITLTGDTTAAWQTKSNTALNEGVSDLNQGGHLLVLKFNAASAVADARFAGVTAKYSIPNLGVGY